MSSLKRGLLTLGSASIFARVVDLIAIVIVLFYLDAEALGEATTAVAAATLFEPLVGLGLGFTLIQRSSHPEGFESRATGLALLSSLLLILAALVPTILLAGAGGLGFLIAAMKLPWVALTLMPLHRLLRSLDYGRYAAAQTAATLVGAVSRIGLAALSAGALTLPAAYALHGLGLYLALLALGVPLARPRLPSAETLRDLGYGVRAASGEFFERAFQQLDVLLIAFTFGHAAVGIYRVAADVFFTVAQALMDLFQRASLPILARANDDLPRFIRSLKDAFRGLNFIFLPLLALIFFAAPSLIALIQDGEFMGATIFFPALALAATVRANLRLLPLAYLARGEAGLALRHSSFGLFALIASFIGAFTLLKSRLGVQAINAAWLSFSILFTGFAIVQARRFFRTLRDTESREHDADTADPSASSIVLIKRQRARSDSLDR